LLAGSAVLLAATVRIYAAASLTDALADVIALFERTNAGVEVLPNFGGSSDLARQIVAGAPADLFFSADEAQMDRLAAEGLLAEGSRRDALSNQLVVVTHRSANSPLEGPRDLIGLSGRIAMADPEAVPAGVYAREYLTKLGLWEEIRSKVVPTLDVRAALAAAAGGNVEAAVVYRTDVSIEPRVRVRFEVPIDEGPRIAYPIAVVRGRKADAVLAFLSFLESAPSRAVFERHGFLALEER
jgi:molybdate transport system substrate-binding protein